MNVLGFSGSLRRASYNTALLHAAQELMPAEMTLEVYDLAPLPMYNADHDGANMPEVVYDFKTRIAGADALLIASPEYNHSVSGVLKNALDWASRGNPSPLSGKPVALMGAATGIFGTVRGYQHLRDIAFATNMHVLNRPMVLVPKVREKFDSEMRLVDEDTRRFITELMSGLQQWTIRLNG
ncbi:MAG: NAD(P)H-dependent FMN reductase [Anaerolineae bacterium]